MTEGELIKHQHLIKWILQTKKGVHSTTSESDPFVIKDCKCYFSFDYGFRDSVPVSLSLNIRLNENQKLNSPAEVIILVLSNSKKFPPERHTITGECDVKLWSSFNYDDIRGSLMTFDMLIFASKEEKSVQTASYIDTCFLVDNISPNFSKMLNEGPCYDLEFICGEQTIKAHKSILCCRSNVFASMLQSDMMEGKTGRVTIKDMDATRFREFLTYLYTGILPTLTIDIGFQFYEAGDKYNISSLKKQCADFLTDNLSSENAYDILIFAARHNDLDFKKNVVDYMIEKQMPYSGEEWNDFCKDNPVLAVEVLNLFCQHLRVK